MKKKMVVRKKKTKSVKRPLKKIKKINKVLRKGKAKPSPVIKKSVIGKDNPEVIGYQETHVAQTKYYLPAQAKVTRDNRGELSDSYGEDLIVLQVRDPWWLYSFWEVTIDSWEKFKKQLGEQFHSAKKALRVYDVSNINFNGKNAHRFFDIEIDNGANSWYIDTGGPGRSWCVDFGLKLADGKFITILRSNVVHTPLDGPSWITDEEWMIPDDLFARLYGMGFGLGQSSPVGKAWRERMKQVLFSGAMASSGIASMASPVKKAKERKFFLVVNCELIVYGATESDAKVTIQGKKINLRPDGTFTLRFALPDGKQTIPVKAESKDSVEERVITPIVSRETKTSQLVKQKA